ncbi:ABC transporter permease [Nocardia transvalensis]|uniref:ABC transporter permease n=1 Tax=Nocardia transvalensis TaxID=37333 RepID=UPI001894B6CB|nr:ABC transporter permease [Nocardia transvalensis]MBF6332531.1 ABC transporter permease [Nocardia transvalensis]
MGSIRAELLKLKRSLSWAVVMLLPLLAVITGVVNTVVSGRQLEDGWHTLWLRAAVFYGLFPLSIGIAVMASLVWRVEHRGGNWNSLMSGPVSSMHVVIGKVTVVAMLAAAMQVVLLATVVAAGKLVFDLPGMLPARYFVISIVIMLACLPVAALQSGLSMLMRSFAAPVAVVLPGAATSVLLLTARLDAVLVVPYAVVTRATQMGTGTFADSGVVTIGGVATVVAVAVVLTVVVTVGAARILDRLDIS